MNIKNEVLFLLTIQHVSGVVRFFLQGGPSPSGLAPDETHGGQRSSLRIGISTASPRQGLTSD